MYSIRMFTNYVFVQKSEVRSQKSEILFEHILYNYTKLSNIFLDITFKRLNVMKIYMYSLYVYISRRLHIRHLSHYRATTSGLKNISLLFKFLNLTEKNYFYVQYYGQRYVITY